MLFIKIVCTLEFIRTAEVEIYTLSFKRTGNSFKWQKA